MNTPFDRFFAAYYTAETLDYLESRSSIGEIGVRRA
jgi:hypothetical protein